MQKKDSEYDPYQQADDSVDKILICLFHYFKYVIL